MTEKNGPGQADKLAAEKRTAKVAEDNERTAEQQKADARPDRPDLPSQATDSAGAALRAGSDDTPQRPDGPDRITGVDASQAPYPLYEEEDVESLRGLAEGRGVEINRDVEKALLIKELRKRDRDGVDSGPDRDDVASDTTNPYPSYDMMPLEELRSLADSRDCHLDPVDEKAHLVTELRAADSGVLAAQARSEQS